tara:strand:+ start:747 stop:2201 length:1455 start_codon:yes stop_codon:yes gene_type:complete
MARAKGSANKHPALDKLVREIMNLEKSLDKRDKLGWAGVERTNLPDASMDRVIDKFAKIEGMKKSGVITANQYDAAIKKLEKAIPSLQRRIANMGVVDGEMFRLPEPAPSSTVPKPNAYFDPAKAGARPVSTPQGLIGTQMPETPRPAIPPKVPGMAGTAGTGDPINLKQSLLADNYTGGPSPEKFGPRGGKTLEELGRVSPIGHGSAMQTMLGEPTRVDPIVTAESRLKPHHPTGALINTGANAEPAGASVRRANKLAAAAKEADPLPGMGPWKQTGRGPIPGEGLSSSGRSIPGRSGLTFTEKPPKLADHGPTRKGRFGFPVHERPNALGTMGVPTKPDQAGASHMMRLREGLKDFDLSKAGKIGGKVAKGGLLGLPLLALDYMAPGNAIASSRREGYGMLDDMGIDIQGGIDSIENPWARGGASLLDGLLIDPAMTAVGGVKKFRNMIMDDIAESKRLKKKRKKNNWKPKLYRGGPQANGS